MAAAGWSAVAALLAALAARRTGAWVPVALVGVRAGRAVARPAWGVIAAGIGGGREDGTRRVVAAGQAAAQGGQMAGLAAGAGLLLRGLTWLGLGLAAVAALVAALAALGLGGATDTGQAPRGETPARAMAWRPLARLLGAQFAGIGLQCIWKALSSIAYHRPASRRFRSAGRGRRPCGHGGGDLGRGRWERPDPGLRRGRGVLAVLARTWRGRPMPGVVPLKPIFTTPAGSVGNFRAVEA
ncbi:MAG: hypothetical protein K6V73_09050 [Firmicutes bacterium]|nr:hypothetical protein [Bacillota bacterium]